MRAEAEGDTSVLALDVSLLNVLVRENAEFSFRLIQLLAERVSHAREEVVAEAASPSPRATARVRTRGPWLRSRARSSRAAFRARFRPPCAAR